MWPVICHTDNSLMKLSKCKFIGQREYEDNQNGADYFI